MRAASNGHGSSASAAARPVTAGASASARPLSRGSTRTSSKKRVTPARAALSELQRLLRTLEAHVAVTDVDTDRDLELLGHTVAITGAEDRLRAVTALLVSLSTYQRLRVCGDPAAAMVADCESADHDIRSRHCVTGEGARAPVSHDHGMASPVSVSVNGVTVHDRPLGNAGATSSGTARVNGASVSAERELAAATARYIARDLAARQLSEFTSAEGYRLARTLARLGGVEQAVEQLLAQANDVRLHPAPLANAVSHSPR